jgi:tRNA(Ile)-lysidine synthase
MQQQNLASRVARTLERELHLRAGERMGVAVSGGADSVALLLLLLELREKLGIVVSVVHFNHKIRGKASDADEKFVTKLAAEHGLTLHVEREDVAGTAKREKMNLEDAARRARYGFFARLMEQGHVGRVAVAHTADDQAETLLAHILRGTGLAGLGGIHPIAAPRSGSGKGQIIRPLLEIRRAELRAYLRAKKQKWREDRTNRDTTKTRARIRWKLLPLLERQFQPASVEHLCRLAELAREDEGFLEDLTRARTAELVKRTAGEARIKAEDLLHPGKEGNLGSGDAERSADSTRNRALTKRMLRQLIEGSKHGPGQITSEHIRAVVELAEQGQSGKSLQLPGGGEVRREENELVFSTSLPSKKTGEALGREQREYERDINLESGEAEVQIAEAGCVFRLRVIDWPRHRRETSKDIGAVLDRERLRLPLVMRNWRPGDRMRPTGHRSAHKLKRLLNEKRISRWERESWPVLTSGGVLVWARGFPVAAEFAANERTETGILIVEETN